MLDKVKAYLRGINSSNADNDALINMLVDDATTFVIDYCNLTCETLPTKFEGTVVKMAIQDYNRLGSQGIAAQSYSGVSESFIDGYSADVMKFLNKNRKLRCL